MDGNAIEHHVDSGTIPDKVVALVFFLIVFHVGAFVSFDCVVMVAITCSLYGFSDLIILLL